MPTSAILTSLTGSTILSTSPSQEDMSLLDVMGRSLILSMIRSATPCLSRFSGTS